MQVAGDVTELLARWRGGDEGALEELIPSVYGELRRLARRAIRGERPDHTLEPTALAHEAYLRLARGRPLSCRDRAHFYAITARLMRRILVDHARTLRAQRRGGGALRVPLGEAEVATSDAPHADLLTLDAALTDLAAFDPRKARVVEMRFLCGLSVEETAELLEVAAPTVILDTRLAKAWLFSRIESGKADGL